jgi:hypothetical protein
MGIRELLRRFKMKSVQAEYEDGRPRSVDNVDAMAAAAANRSIDPMGGQHGAVPPNYVKIDDGRPRH